MRNCQFLCNRTEYYSHNNYSFGACVNVRAMVDATIEGCTFVSNVTSGTATYNYASTVYVRTEEDRKVVVRNCTFRENVATNDCATGICGFDSSSTNLLLSGCHFLRNGGRPCLRVNTSMKPGLRVHGCRFADNVVDYGTGSGTGGAVLGSSGGRYYSVEFVNCLMEGNFSRGASVTGNGHTISGSSELNLSLVNCTLRNNDCFLTDGTTDTRQTDIYTAESYVYRHGGQSAFVNNVMCHTNADYTAVALTDYAKYYVFAGNYLQGTDLSGIVPDTQFRGWNENDLTDVEGAPGFAALPVKVKGMPFAALDTSSPLRRKGSPVWLGSDGWCYVYNTRLSSWQSLRTNGTALYTLTDEAAAALGLAQTHAFVPDARDTSRSKKITPGAIEPRSGFAIIVR